MTNVDLNYKEFERICLEQLRFLRDDFQFALVKTEREPYGVFITYQNATTAVRVSFEPREGGIFVLLSKLVRGKIPAYPIFIKASTRLNSFYLDDLVCLKASEKLTSKFAWQRASSGDEIATVLVEIATMLRKFASDVLSGDFGIFADLERVVKNRARALGKKNFTPTS